MKFEELIKEVKFEVEFGGEKLAPAIVQDADKGDVLMMAWMNEEALRRTHECGEMVFWSRSRKEYWHKGDTRCVCKVRKSLATRVPAAAFSRSAKIKTNA